MSDAVRRLRERASRDPLAQSAVDRLAGRTLSPKITDESSFRHYGQAAGVPAERFRVLGLMLFLSEIGVAEFCQEESAGPSEVRWLVNPITLARRVKGLVWEITDDELNAFMASL
jgi:hypothetical protein